MIRPAATFGVSFAIAGAVIVGGSNAPAGPSSFEGVCRPKPHTLSGQRLKSLVLKAPVRLATSSDDLVRIDCVGLRFARIGIIGTAAHGFADSALIVHGRLHDRTPVTIVPVISGGSGGIFETLVFTGLPGAEHYVATLRGVEPGHLRVSVENGYLVERSPQDSTATCCWRHDYVRRSTIRNGRVRVMDVRIRPNLHPA